MKRGPLGWTLSLNVVNRGAADRQFVDSIEISDAKGEALVPHKTAPGLHQASKREAAGAQVVRQHKIPAGLPEGYYRAQALVSSVERGKSATHSGAGVPHTQSSTMYFAIFGDSVEVLEPEQWLRESGILTATVHFREGARERVLAELKQADAKEEVAP